MREKASARRPGTGRGGLAWTSVEGTAQVELPWSIEPHLHGRKVGFEQDGEVIHAGLPHLLFRLRLS